MLEMFLLKVLKWSLVTLSWVQHIIFLEYLYLLVNHVQLSNISFKLNVYIKIPGEDAYNLKCELYAAVRTVLTI